VAGQACNNDGRHREEVMRRKRGHRRWRHSFGPISDL
jgi:hypothetical protein